MENSNNNNLIKESSSEIIKLVDSSAILYFDSENDNSSIKDISKKSLLGVEEDDEEDDEKDDEKYEEVYDQENEKEYRNSNQLDTNIDINTPGEDVENFKDFLYEKQNTPNIEKKSILSIFSKIKNNKKRIITAFLIINLGFPLFLSYNNPTSMVNIFKKEYSIDATQFGRLYSLYAIPNVIMVFLGGILVDLIGTNKCSLIFSFILTISTILASISSSTHSYGLLLFSRILLGLGGESLLVCVATYITDMFESDQVSLVMGIEATWVQFGSLVAFGVLPSFYNATNFPMTMWFIAIIATIVSILNIVFIIYQPKLRFNKEQPIPLIDQDQNDKEKDKLDTIEFDGASAILKKNDSFENHGRNEIEMVDDSNDITKEEKEDTPYGDSEINNKSFIVLFKENIIQAFNIVKSMSIRTWILTIVAFFGYSAFFGLDIIFTDMAIERYGYSDAFAAGIMASETFTTGIVSPLFGIFVKKLERNILAMGIGIMMTMVGIFLIVVTDVMPIAFVILSGCGYTLMSNAIYSSIPLIVDDDSVGTAYGCVGTSYNIGIVIFPLFLTLFRSKTGNYILSMWLLILSSILAIICLFILKYYDNKEIDHNKKLDKNGYNFLKYFKLK